MTPEERSEISARLLQNATEISELRIALRKIAEGQMKDPVRYARRIIDKRWRDANKRWRDAKHQNERNAR